jgi:hypothetical protein
MKLNEILDDLQIKDHREFVDKFNVSKLDEVNKSLEKFSKEKIQLLNLNTKKVEEFSARDVFAKVLLNTTAKKMYAIPGIDGIELQEKGSTPVKPPKAPKAPKAPKVEPESEDEQDNMYHPENEDNFEVSEQDVVEASKPKTKGKPK